MTRKYYKAYDDRYKVIHEKGYSWSSNIPTPIVLQLLKEYNIHPKSDILEIGCGEGRDSIAVMDAGYHLLATDVSKEAIQYCKNTYSKYASNFTALDCLEDHLDQKYDFIFSIAVIHMLVLNEDRKKYLSFIKEHLNDVGYALICSMGDGKTEMKSDIHKAFDIVKREHESGSIFVSSTSCRMVSFETLEKELNDSGLTIIKKGITESLPDFNSLMYIIVSKSD